MKTVRFIAALMFFAAFATVTSFAQAPAGAASATTKVGIIDTSAFAVDKTGIQKFVNAYRQLEAEFGPRRTEITTMENRLKQLQNEVTTMQAQLQKPGSPISPESVQKKIEEGQVLQTDYTRKVEDYKAAVQRREAATVGPIYQDIGKAIQEYAKQKGFTAIIDISKDQNAMILWADMATVDATTADFIKFYNSRPGGTAATTAAPK